MTKTITTRSRNLSYGACVLTDGLPAPHPEVGGLRTVERGAMLARREFTGRPGVGGAGVRWTESLFVDGQRVLEDVEVPMLIELLRENKSWKVLVEV